MSVLANTHSVPGNAALHSAFSTIVENTKAFFVALGRAVAFSRQCEAEFARTGRVSEKTLSLISSSHPAGSGN